MRGLVGVFVVAATALVGVPVAAAGTYDVVAWRGTSRRVSVVVRP
jgi:hypothetical protein